MPDDSEFEYRPWRGRRLPKSSVIWGDELPDEDAPPWVCLAEPGAPVVVRRYDATSRTCDSVSSHGRWLIESALVPRHAIVSSEIQHGWDLAVGDVQPGWCIVYAGHQLWFPQRILRVDNISEEWQRVWTLGDVGMRDVWDVEKEYEWDNGLATGWALDEMSWPFWQKEGPWWPLQSEPLSVNVRRFLLKKFGLAGECPECGQFGKRIVFGMIATPLGPHIVAGGCGVTWHDPEFICDQGHGWAVSDQGAIRETEASFLEFDLSKFHEKFGISPKELPVSDQPKVIVTVPEPAELNYNWDGVYPYGKASEHFYQDVVLAIVREVGGDLADDETFDDDLEFFLESFNAEQWLEPDR